jgi:hypothetical protein
VTVDAMPVPAVDTAAAAIDAERLRRASRLAGQAVARLPETAPSQWYGGAATAYDATRAELARCLDDVQRLSRLAADAVDRYADAVQPQLLRMRAAAEDLDVALRLQAADPASARAAALVQRAWLDHEAAQRRYRAAVLDAVDVLRPIPTQVSPAAQGPGRHARTATQRLWQETVAAPLETGWQLTAGLVQDPAAWWSAVSSMPPAWLDRLRHPLRTLDEMVAGEDWRAGEWGAGVGSLLSTAVGARGLRKALAPEHVRQRFARNMADPNAPRPRVQTVDEMLAGVDLDAHEHHSLGHAIRRHVEVDDDYLEDRLVNGTLYDDGFRGPPPRDGMASAWADRATAEHWVTECLRRHETELRAWAAEPTTDYLRLEIPAPPDVGRILVRGSDGPEVRAPATVRVVVAKQGGVPYVNTAYPNGA